MRSCRVDGLLLKPDRPAVSMDETFKASAFGASFGAQGQVWATYSTVGQERYNHVFAAEVTHEFDLRPSALSLDGGASGDGVAYAIANTTSLDISTLAVQEFSYKSPIVLKKSASLQSFELWHTAPLHSNGIALLGELLLVVIAMLISKRTNTQQHSIHVHAYAHSTPLLLPLHSLAWFAWPIRGVEQMGADVKQTHFVRVGERLQHHSDHRWLQRRNGAALLCIRQQRRIHHQICKVHCRWQWHMHHHIPLSSKAHSVSPPPLSFFSVLHSFRTLVVFFGGFSFHLPSLHFPPLFPLQHHFPHMPFLCMSVCLCLCMLGFGC